MYSMQKLFAIWACYFVYLYSLVMLNSRTCYFSAAYTDFSPILVGNIDNCKLPWSHSLYATAWNNYTLFFRMNKHSFFKLWCLILKKICCGSSLSSISFVAMLWKSANSSWRHCNSVELLPFDT